jgi:S-adenosyl methyltransferase
MTEATAVPPGVDPSQPSPARMYDYFLGGEHNFPADRAAADQLLSFTPDVKDGVLANRGFHQRATIWMAQQGIGQFLDLGSGLPTQDNTHDAVRRVKHGCRVVYVDHDPMVAAQGSALLAGDGSTAIVTADITDPEAVLADPRTRGLIDFSQPVGVLMTAVFHFMADDARPWEIPARYMAAVAAGSYLAVSHMSADGIPAAGLATAASAYSGTRSGIYPRNRAEVARFFDGLELVPPYPGAEPGLSHVGVWGAEDPDAADTEGSRGVYCAVARRP